MIFKKYSTNIILDHYLYQSIHKIFSIVLFIKMHNKRLIIKTVSNKLNWRCHSLRNWLYFEVFDIDCHQFILQTISIFLFKCVINCSCFKKWKAIRTIINTSFSFITLVLKKGVGRSISWDQCDNWVRISDHDIYQW